MGLQITRGYGVQEVPADFAQAMRRLKEEKSPLLNVVLVSARRLRWRTESLAAALEIPVSAVSKRMERAEPTSWPVRMRDISSLTLREFNRRLAEVRQEYPEVVDDAEAEGIADDLEYLVQVRVGTELTDGETVSREDVVSVSTRARQGLTALAGRLTPIGTLAARKYAKLLTTLARRLERAESYEPSPMPVAVDASAADESWLSNMARQLVAARNQLVRQVPEFDSPQPGQRAKIEAALAALRKKVDARTISVEEAMVASGRIREDLRLLKMFAKSAPGRAGIVRQLTDIWNRLRLAEEFVGGPIRVGDIDIPIAPPVQTMLHGEALDEQTIEMLRQLQSVASQVNGGTAPDSAQWRASRKLSEELWRLNNPTEPGATRYTAYYLARVMGITHHAVITRLRRYQASQEVQRILKTAGRSSAARRRAKRSVTEAS